MSNFFDTATLIFAFVLLMFLVDKLGAAFYCGAFSSFTIVILNMIEKGYTYIYLALALAAMFGMMQRYHRD